MTIDDKRNELREICGKHADYCDDCPISSVSTVCNFEDDECVELIYAAIRNAVYHPARYSGKHECIEIMRVMFGDEAVKAFCRCNSFKYRFRASRKNGGEDIAKAEWYEDYLFNLEKGDKS